MTQAEVDRIIRKATNSGYKARSKQVGNGESLVIIKDYQDHDVYLWCKEDWSKFANGTLLTSVESEVA